MSGFPAWMLWSQAPHMLLQLNSQALMWTASVVRSPLTGKALLHLSSLQGTTFHEISNDLEQISCWLDVELHSQESFHRTDPNRFSKYVVVSTSQIKVNKCFAHMLLLWESFDEGMAFVDRSVCNAITVLFWAAWWYQAAGLQTGGKTMVTVTEMAVSMEMGAFITDGIFNKVHTEPFGDCPRMQMLEPSLQNSCTFITSANNYESSTFAMPTMDY